MLKALSGYTHSAPWGISWSRPLSTWCTLKVGRLALTAHKVFVMGSLGVWPLDSKRGNFKEPNKSAWHFMIDPLVSTCKPGIKQCPLEFRRESLPCHKRSSWGQYWDCYLWGRLICNSGWGPPSSLLYRWGNEGRQSMNRQVQLP